MKTDRTMEEARAEVAINEAIRTAAMATRIASREIMIAITALAAARMFVAARRSPEGIKAHDEVIDTLTSVHDVVCVAIRRLGG